MVLDTHDDGKERHTHILLDLELDDATAALDTAAWREILHAAAAAGGATVLGEQFHQFQPQGVTGFLLLAESHLSVHTWPENNHAAIDLFSCGSMDTAAAIHLLRHRLHPRTERLQTIARG